MKILKIEGGKGLFWNPSDGSWKPIDEIDKEELMNLLNLLLAEEVEMDDLAEHEISNKAQNIVYSSIFEKFSDLKTNKSKFKDESDRKYLNEIKKYEESSSSEQN